MHFLEISMIFFCPGNIGRYLHTIIKKKTLSEGKVPFDSFKSTVYFTVLHLSSIKIDLEKPKKVCM